MTNLFSQIEKKKKFNVGFNSNSLIKNCIKVSIVAVSMSAIVACGGGGGGGSKGNSGSNNGQPAINVNVNNANNNANNNVNSNTNTMLVTGLTLSIAPNMLSNLQGFINLASSTITIAGTNERANIQTTPAGVMVLTFDNLKNIYAGQNVTLEINDGTHTASAVVSTTKEGSGTTGTTGSTTGGTNSGTTSGNSGNGNNGNNGNGANGGNGNNGNGQTNGQGTNGQGANGQGANGHGTNGHSGEQEIDFKVEGGVDPQTGKPIIKTQPLTCQVDTIETPENPRHNVGMNGANGVNAPGVGINYGSINTKAGDALANRWANATSLAQVSNYYGLGAGAHHYNCIDQDPASAGIGGLPSIVTKHVYNMLISVPTNRLSNLELRNTTYRILETNASVVANYNATTTALDFSITNAECIPDGETATLELTDGINIEQVRMVAHEGQIINITSYNANPNPIIGNGMIINGTGEQIKANDIHCDNDMTEDLIKSMGTSAPKTPYNDYILSETIQIAQNQITSTNNITYCTMNRFASTDNMPVSQPVILSADMFKETGHNTNTYAATIKLIPANGCEKAFDILARTDHTVFCTDGTNVFSPLATTPPHSSLEKGDTTTTGILALALARYNNGWSHP